VCRFGSARLADRILVLAGGRIAEKDTHAELMQRGGLCQQLTGLAVSLSLPRWLLRRPGGLE